jgi:hypothetical protein
MRPNLANIGPLLTTLEPAASIPSQARDMAALVGRQITDLETKIKEIDAKLTAMHKANEVSQRLATSKQRMGGISRADNERLWVLLVTGATSVIKAAMSPHMHQRASRPASRLTSWPPLTPYRRQCARSLGKRKPVVPALSTHDGEGRQ